MLTAATISQAVAVEKAMYLALTELEELTQELSQAVNRGDNVSVHMFMAMRQEPLDQLMKYKASLNRLCAGLPEADAQLLHQILEQPSPPTCAGGEALAQQVSRNRALWERVVRADRQVNMKLTGPSSFYTREP